MSEPTGRWGIEFIHNRIRIVLPDKKKLHDAVVQASRCHDRSELIQRTPAWLRHRLLVHIAPRPRRNLGHGSISPSQGSFRSRSMRTRSRHGAT